MENIIFENNSGVIFENKAAVVVADSKNIFDDPDAAPVDITIGTKQYQVVPWGENNDLPMQIIQAVDKSPDLSTGLFFNVKAGFGDGITACTYELDKDGKKVIKPVYDNVEINRFFEDNDINGYFLEQLTDLDYFFNVFPEVILNREKPESRKVVSLSHKEAAFSRWGVMDKKSGQITQHFYSAQWDDASTEAPSYVVTPVLNAKRPIKDLLIRIGREPDARNRTKDEKKFRYIVPVSFPSPGRTYYQKPYWYSIIESGWYDFAVAIPEFKKYLIQNGMTIKYIIYLADDYFTTLFAKEGITDVAKQKARVQKEYDDLNKYLTGLKNTGKSMITYFKTFPDGKEQRRIDIQVIDNKFKGGEYLEDSSEVSNMIAYTLGVHPSIIGASPGKNSNNSGSDKRELFIMKQALLKSIRDRLLRPLYLVKAINKWPDNIHFTIPNIELTTLDKNKTGNETKLS